MSGNSLTTDQKLNIAFEKLNEISDQISDIDARLNSWALSIREMVGVGVEIDPEDPDTILLAKNNMLSREGLKLKRIFLERAAKQAITDISILEQNKSKEIREILEAISRNNSQEAIRLQRELGSLYAKNPSIFFEQMFAQPSEFSSVDMMMAVADQFDENVNSDLLYRCWRIAFKAKDTAFKQLQAEIKKFNSNGVYDPELIIKLEVMYQQYSSAENRMFRFLIASLPVGMQGLMLLYNNKEYDKIISYIEQAREHSRSNNNQSYNELLKQLAEDVSNATISAARVKLFKIEGFLDLEPEYQQLLIEQYALIVRTKFDLQFVADSYPDLEELKEHMRIRSDQIIEDIQNAIKNKKTLKEYEAIQSKNLSQLNRTEDRLRLELFGKQMAGDSAKYFIGAGLTALVFAGPLAATAVIGASAFKAFTEAKNAKLPNLAHAMVENQSMDPADYNFILEQDQMWGIEPSNLYDVDMEEALVANRILKVMFDDYYKQFHKDLDKTIWSPIGLSKEKSKNPSVIKPVISIAAKVAVGIPAWTSIIWGAIAIGFVAAGAVAPPLWPIYAAIGVGMVAAVAFAAVKSNIDLESPANKVLDRVANIISLPLRPFVAVLNFTLRQTIIEPVNIMTSKLISENPRDGQFILGAAVVGAVALGFGLGALGPVIGVAAVAAGILGTIGGAILGLSMAGGMVRAKDNIVTYGTVSKARVKRNHTMEPESLQTLDALSPGFSVLLAKHFQDRISNMQTSLQGADKGEQLEIAKEIGELEKIWDMIVNTSVDPEKCLPLIDSYLRHRYIEERKVYIDLAKSHKEHSDSLRDIPQATLSFVSKSEFYATDRQNITELKHLRNNLLQAESKV